MTIKTFTAAAAAAALLGFAAAPAAAGTITDFDGFTYTVKNFVGGEKTNPFSATYTDDLDADPSFTFDVPVPGAVDVIVSYSVEDTTLSLNFDQANLGNLSGGAETSFTYKINGPGFLSGASVLDDTILDQGAAVSVANGLLTAVIPAGSQLLDTGSVTFELEGISHVPLPAPLALLLSGVAGLAALRARRSA